MSYRRSGFTLVEMAILVVVLGLLVGSVLIARNLIDVAKSRGVLAEMKLYQEAVYNFNLKYGELPGDMLYPGRHWPDEAWDATMIPYHGDGIIHWEAEGIDAWRQLELAEFLLISG